MAIQLRHQTQGSNLPSAASHGVGLPVSDGGLGAASQALGQVAGAAGQIGARLAQKEDALYAQRARNIYSDATIEAARLQKEINTLRDLGQDVQPLMDEFRAKFDSSNKNYPGLQQFKGDREINDKYLEPYEQNIRELYTSWDISEKATKLVLESEQAHKEAYLPGQVLSEKVIAAGVVTPEDMVSMAELLNTNLPTPLLDGKRVSEAAIKSRIQVPINTLENFMRVSVATVERNVNIESANETIRGLRQMVKSINTNGHPQMEKWKADSFARLDEFEVSNKASPRVTQVFDETILGVKRMINTGKDSIGFIEQARENMLAAHPYADEKQAAQILSFSLALDKIQELIENPQARRTAIEAVGRGEKVFLDEGSGAVIDQHRAFVEEYAKKIAERYENAKEPLDQARVLNHALDSEYNRIYNDPEMTLEKKIHQAKLLNQEIYKPEGPVDLNYYSDPKEKTGEPFRATRVEGFQGDGDSFKVTRDGEEVEIRLYNYDAPEYGEEYGKESAAFVRDLLKGQDFEVIPVKEDKYGRLLANIKLSDGRDLRKVLVYAEQGHDSSNLGKKLLFGKVQHNLTPEDMSQLRVSLGPDGFQPNIEVPFIEEETQKVFARNPETNEFVSSPMEMASFIRDFSGAIKRSGFPGPAVYAKYHDSEDPEIAAFAVSNWLFEATSENMDHPVFQAYITNTELSPESERLVGSAKSLWGSEKFSNKYSKSRNAQMTLDNMGEYGLSRLVGDLQEPLLRQGIALATKTHPDKGQSFILEEGIKYADNALNSVITPLQLSEVGMGRDTYLTKNMLKGLNIQPGLLDRALGAVGPKPFAYAVGRSATDTFLDSFGEGVAGVSLFELNEPGPNASVVDKTWFATQMAISDAWKKAIGGNKSELERLLNEGVIRYNFQGVDDSGQYVTTIQVAQPNGLWRDVTSPDARKLVSVPTKDILDPVIQDPKKYFTRPGRDAVLFQYLGPTISPFKEHGYSN